MFMGFIFLIYNSHVYDLYHHYKVSLSCLMMYESYWDIERRDDNFNLHGHCKIALNHHSPTLSNHVHCLQLPNVNHK